MHKEERYASMNSTEVNKEKFRRYAPLAYAGGIGSLLGSGIIVGLSATITVWQQGLKLDVGQVGIISGALTFAIAFGSIFGGRIADSVGRVLIFNWINAIYAIGALICAFSANYWMLLIGVVITGVASGTDLPVSLAVISHDAPNSEAQAKLVSSTQIFWQIGIFISYVCAFIVSAMAVNGARIVFLILATLAIIAWIWRTTSRTFRLFHKEADERLQTLGEEGFKTTKVSVAKFLFGRKRQYLYFFLSILVFYLAWNLLANTFGQFQTFMFVQAKASQTLATGLGIFTNIVGVIMSLFATQWVSGPHRKIWFITGSILNMLAISIIAAFGSTVWFILLGVTLNAIGGGIAGEAMYKVWTQESFPVSVRASIQGIINGLSRFLCALFAMITPMLVMPERIKGTMWMFVGIIAISMVAGILMIHFQAKYGTDAARIDSESLKQDKEALEG